MKDFFYDVNEIDVYKIFSSLGYRKLLSFELSRLCTTTRLPISFKRQLVPSKDQLLLWGNERDSQAPYERDGKVGVLPQGAPSSPALSNLAARELDVSLSLYASNNGFVYTRYADDLTFSAYDLPAGKGEIHRAIVHRIRKTGFKENDKKTRVAGPGSKKMVLGLMVDGSQPRLSRETYKRIDRHLYASKKYGLHNTATHEKFDSSYGFYNHLAGLVAYVKDVDIPRWEEFNERLIQINTSWRVS